MTNPSVVDSSRCLETKQYRLETIVFGKQWKSKNHGRKSAWKYSASEDIRKNVKEPQQVSIIKTEANLVMLDITDESRVSVTTTTL